MTGSVTGIRRRRTVAGRRETSHLPPDRAFYGQTLFRDVERLSAFDSEFYRLNIAIARDEKDVVIPMLARKSLFADAPRTSDPVRGVLWLQGYCVDHVFEGDGNA